MLWLGTPLCLGLRRRVYQLTKEYYFQDFKAQIK